MFSQGRFACFYYDRETIRSPSGNTVWWDDCSSKKSFVCEKSVWGDDMEEHLLNTDYVL